MEAPNGTSPTGGNISNGRDNQLASFLITTYATVVVFIGSVGNLLTFYTTVRVKELRTTPIALVASLALTDVFNVLICIPAFLFRFLFPNFYKEHGTACKASVYLILILVTVSINTLQVIAANRYFIITQPRYIYLKYWSRFNTGLIIAFIWFYCFFLACLPLFGFGEIGYIPEIGGCSIKESTQLSWWYKTILLLTVVESCGIVTPVFFLLTFIKIRSNKRRLQSACMANQLNTQVRPKGLSREEIAVTKMTAVVFFCFLFCWCPYFIFHIATIDKAKPGGLDTFLVIFAGSNSALNPFIYAGMNTKIRRAICLSLLGNPQKFSVATVSSSL